MRTRIAGPAHATPTACRHATFLRTPQSTRRERHRAYANGSAVDGPTEPGHQPCRSAEPSHPRLRRTTRLSEDPPRVQATDQPILPRQVPRRQAGRVGGGGGVLGGESAPEPRCGSEAIRPAVPRSQGIATRPRSAWRAVSPRGDWITCSEPRCPSRCRCNRPARAGARPAVSGPHQCHARQLGWRSTVVTFHALWRFDSCREECDGCREKCDSSSEKCDGRGEHTGAAAGQRGEVPRPGSPIPSYVRRRHGHSIVAAAERRPWSHNDKKERGRPGPAARRVLPSLSQSVAYARDNCREKETSIVMRILRHSS